MKNIKKMMTAATLMMVLMASTSFGGIIVHATDTPQPCTSAETSKKFGVILSDITGIIVHLTTTTGIIVHVSRTDVPVDCGIIVH
jgi:hypothetical protein